MKDGNKSYQTTNKDHKCKEEHDSSRNLVIAAASSILEESRASRVFVTGDKSNLGTFFAIGTSTLRRDTGLVTNFSFKTENRVEGTTAITAGFLVLCECFCNALVCLKDKTCKRINKYFDWTYPFISFSNLIRDNSL